MDIGWRRNERARRNVRRVPEVVFLDKPDIAHIADFVGFNHVALIGEARRAVPVTVAKVHAVANIYGAETVVGVGAVGGHASRIVNGGTGLQVREDYRTPRSDVVANHRGGLRPIGGAVNPLADILADIGAPPSVEKTVDRSSHFIGVGLNPTGIEYGTVGRWRTDQES
jgi:hypothetical protein